jgi:hypothetical protein
MLQHLQQNAQSDNNYVDLSFYSIMLDAIKEYVPNDFKPSEKELAAVVATRPAEAVVEVPLDEREAFLESIPELVSALGDSLVPVDLRNKVSPDDTEAGFGDIPPHKSKQQVAKLQREKQRQMLDAVKEMLAVTSDMPEQHLSLTQAEIVSELVSAGVEQHLVCCLDTTRSADVRQHAAGGSLCSMLPNFLGLMVYQYSHSYLHYILCDTVDRADKAAQRQQKPSARATTRNLTTNRHCQAALCPTWHCVCFHHSCILFPCVYATKQICFYGAELLERMIGVQHSLADAIVQCFGVQACIKALVFPDPTINSKEIALKSGKAAAVAGSDMFTPRLRAARLLKQLCLHSDAAKAYLSRPPTSAYF